MRDLNTIATQCYFVMKVISGSTLELDNISLIKFFIKMKRQLTSILLFSALLMGGASTFVSCTDHESDAAYEVTGSIADQLKNHATEFQGYINTLNGNVTQLQKDLEKLKKETTDPTGAVQTQISKLQTNISTLETELGTAQTAITAAQTTADKALAAAQQAATNANAYTDAEITKLKNELVQADANLTQEISAVRTLAESNKTAIDNLTTQVNKNTQDISTNVQNIAANGQRIDELATLLDNLETNCSQMITNLFNLYNDLDSRLALDEEALDLVKQGQITLNEAVESLNTKLDAKVDTADFEAVKAQVDKNKEAIKGIKANVDSIKTELAKKVSQEDFDVLNGKVSDMDAAYKKADQELEARVQAQIDSINIKLNQLFDKMMNMLTGIELQATESPITGYENFSFLGAEAHILGTYYGSTAAAVKLGNEEIADANQVLIDETSGENAGVIYATLNPSNVDFTGCTLKVVDSQGNEAPFTATVVKSNRVLKYGISRAGKSNLYAIKINLNKENLEAAKTWTSSDAAALKDVAKNVLDKLRQPSTTRLNIGDAATTIAKTFNNRLTAYALQAEQTYTDANGKEQTRTITSKMSLAATAIKPVSYNFLKDNQTLKNLDLPSFPTLQSKINFNDYKFNWTPIEGMGTVKTSVTLKGMPDLDSIKVSIDGEVKAPTVDVKNGTISFGQKTLTGELGKDGKVTFDLSELEKNTTAKVDVAIGNIKIDPKDLKVTLDTSKTKDATYDVEIPMDEFNKIIANINSQVGNMIGNVNGIVDKVQNYADIIDGKYIAGINKFIQKFENLLRKSNSLLQPAMFYVTSNGSWNQLARESEGASYLKLQGGKASTVFVASSYTGEILAPAYKKYVHVTKAPEGAHVTGVNLKKVIDGNLHKIGFEADKEGTYEITYEAVDYSGVKAAKKTFYVKVVK